MTGRAKEFGCHLVTSRYTIPRLLEYAALLDRLGYDRISIGDHTLIPDHTAQYPNAQALLGAIAFATKRAKLSTGVTDCFRRHPVEIAQYIATLDRMTNGRAALGIGAGEKMNLEPYGIEWSTPLKRLRETIQVIKLLWKASPDEPTSFSGDIFNLRYAYLQVKPVQEPHPPVYVGAAGTKSRELTGMLAEGWWALATESPETLRRHIGDVERGAKKVGKQPEDLETIVTVYTDVSDDEEKAYKTVEATTKSMLIQHRETLRELTGIEVPTRLSVQQLDATDRSVASEVSEIAAKIPRSVVEQISVSGSVETCIGRLEEYLQAGATTIIICNLSEEQERVFETYAKSIFPYLRESYGLGR